MERNEKRVTMSEIKIFVTHTPNRRTLQLNNALFYNVIAGSDFQTMPLADGMLQDNQGENISSKNKSYCELTTQYWAWKNVDADYYGFCHYRRVFSFNKKMLPEDDWGCIAYPFMDEMAEKELQLDESTIKAFVENYDFLIAKGIQVKKLNAKTVYDHYAKAPALNIHDVDLLLKIIGEKYPFLKSVADKYFAGTVFYPCNMFIMKKELFQEYSEILFDVLEEFEKRADVSLYSREGYRTIGHLGERMAGIYYQYVQEQGKYRLGELQVAFFQNAESDVEIEEKAMKDSIPVVLAANQNYVPILYTCIQSVADHINNTDKYEIFIFHTDIDKESQEIFQSHLQRENFRIRFINVVKKVNGYRLKAKEHITTETFYRFLILDILKKYPKVVYLDSDMIIRKDVAELYRIELGDTLIAAAMDPDFIGQYNGANCETRTYCENILKLKDPYTYFQAGVLVLNVAELNKVITVEQLFDMSDTGIYKYSDQDILNIVCENRVTYLDMSWNLLTDCDHYRWNHVIKYAPVSVLEEYEKARKHPYIVHYAGFLKPWMKPDEDFAYEFWKVARSTVYYEVILSNMQFSVTKELKKKNSLKNKVRTWAKEVLPKGSWIRRTAGKIYHKIG